MDRGFKRLPPLQTPPDLYLFTCSPGSRSRAIYDDNHVGRTWTLDLNCPPRIPDRKWLSWMFFDSHLASTRHAYGAVPCLASLSIHSKRSLSSPSSRWSYEWPCSIEYGACCSVVWVYDCERDVRRLNMSDSVVLQRFSQRPDVYEGVDCVIMHLRNCWSCAWYQIIVVLFRPEGDWRWRWDFDKLLLLVCRGLFHPNWVHVPFGRNTIHQTNVVFGK